MGTKEKGRRPERKEARDWYAEEWKEIERLKRELAEIDKAMRDTLARAGQDAPF